jgi:co-chaperonin GroES (HSP10)
MSKLESRGGSIILKQLEENEMKVGNIIIPDVGHEKSLVAEIIAVSNTFNWHRGEFVPSDLKVGQKVVIPPMGAQKLTLDNVDYLIISQEQIPAIIVD